MDSSWNRGLRILYSGSADIGNAFYRFRVPDGLADQFSLPTIPAGALGLDSLDGVGLPAHTQILPVVTVLPMGWAWSLHFCQSVMMRAISDWFYTRPHHPGPKRIPNYRACDRLRGGWLRRQRSRRWNLS